MASHGTKQQQQQPEPTAIDYADEVRRHFERKANHNKNESLGVLTLILLATTLSPLFISFGEDVWYGKIIPSVLSLAAASLTAWMQLRRPQQLWGIYRDAERQIEVQIARCRYAVGDYGENGVTRSPEKLLVDSVTSILMATHERWMGVLPGPESIKLALQLPKGPGDKSSP